MSHQRMNYEQIIRAAGHRVTPQRLQILDAVCEAKGHTTIGEIYARVRAYDKTLDRSTIYRTLKLFTELELVVAADIGKGETVYEIAKPQHHHHLVCRFCGREQEISDEVFQRLFDDVFRQYQFSVETDHLVLFGTCVLHQDAQS